MEQWHSPTSEITHFKLCPKVHSGSGRGRGGNCKIADATRFFNWWHRHRRKGNSYNLQITLLMSDHLNALVDTAFALLTVSMTAVMWCVMCARVTARDSVTWLSVFVVTPHTAAITHHTIQWNKIITWQIMFSTPSLSRAALMMMLWFRIQTCFLLTMD